MSCAISAMLLLRLRFSAWAKKFGVKPRSSMTFSTRRRVSAETGRLPESTCDTVVLLTPAAAATAWIVTVLAPARLSCVPSKPVLSVVMLNLH